MEAMNETQITRALWVGAAAIVVAAVTLTVVLPFSAVVVMALLVGAALVARLAAEVFVRAHRGRNLTSDR